jgi:hypothetical protein
MHENGIFVRTCHFGATKTYRGGEHANANMVLDMKVINELEQGHTLVVSKHEILIVERIWELLQHYKFPKARSNFLLPCSLWFDLLVSKLC